MNISMRITSMIIIVTFLSVVSLANANVLNMPDGLTSLETVRVGNAWNGNDTWGDGHGQVAYEYSIGKYEVTAGQYTEFLNAVAVTDRFGLYNPKMWSDYYGCKIWRQWSPNGYSYSVADDWANRPVNFVSWSDAARFCNWLHNGQPTGEQWYDTTEVGTYLLNGSTNNTNIMNVKRMNFGTWAIPTEDEWYKAAYHANDGSTSNYYKYPTGADEEPDNLLGDPTDPGNTVTFRKSGVSFTIRAPYWRTEVGEHENSASPYGTFDQGGNVEEWNETSFFDRYRGIRGGSFQKDEYYLRASSSRDNAPSLELAYTGFRVVYIPEPTTFTLIMSMGMLFFLRGHGQK